MRTLDYSHELSDKQITNKMHMYKDTMIDKSHLKLAQSASQTISWATISWADMRIPLKSVDLSYAHLIWCRNSALSICTLPATCTSSNVTPNLP